jgi:hypothetical protein
VLSKLSSHKMDRVRVPSIIHLGQDAAFVHRDVVGFFALSFILRFILAGAMHNRPRCICPLYSTSLKWAFAILPITYLDSEFQVMIAHREPFSHDAAS